MNVSYNVYGGQLAESVQKDKKFSTNLAIIPRDMIPPLLPLDVIVKKASSNHLQRH